MIKKILKSALNLFIVGCLILIAIPKGSVFALEYDPFDRYGKGLPWLTDPAWGAQQMVLTVPPNLHLSNYGFYAQDFARNGGDAATLGIPVLAISDGRIIEVGNEPVSRGNYIRIDHENGYISEYDHLLFNVFRPSDIGTVIRKGQEVGLIGQTGRAFGANLQFAMLDSSGRYIKATVDGRPFEGAYTWQQPPNEHWIEPVDNFDKYQFSMFHSHNTVREDDPTNPWDPPVIDPLDRYLENYGYLFPSGMIAEPVNSHLGSFITRSEDISFTEINNHPFKFERVYNSPDKFIGMNGRGWMNGFNIRIMAHNDFKYSIKFADGRGEVFVETDNDKRTFNDSFNTVTPESTGTLRRHGEDQGYRFYYIDKSKTEYTFNSDREGKNWGKIERIKYLDGKTLNFEYNGNGDLMKVTDSDGRFFSFEYSDTNLLSKIATSDGRTVSYDYNFDGYLTQVTKANGSKWIYSYDANGNITSIIDGENKNYVSNSFDSSDRITSQVDGNNGITKFEYSDETNFLGQATGNKVTKITDPKGNTTTHIHNDRGYLVRDTAANGGEVKYDYNSKGQVTQKQLADGTQYKFEYDGNGNTTKEIKPNGYSKSIEYSDKNLPTKVTDNTGSVEYKYNDAGVVTEKKDQKGNISSYSYDDKNNLTKVVEADGSTKEYVYNSNNLVEKEILHSNTGDASLSHTYDAQGNRTSTTDALGNKTLFEYNSLRKVTQITDPNGNITKYEYDANGNLVKEIDPIGAKKTYKTDPNENIIEIVNHVPETKTYTYTIQGEGDIANQDGSNLDVYSRPDNLKAESWIGTGADTENSYLGLLLHGKNAIPANAKILNAYVEFYNNHSLGKDSWQWIITSFDIYTEKSSTPTKYSVEAIPSNRQLTTAKTSYAGDEKWYKNTWWKLDITAPIQELSDTIGVGKDVSLVVKGTSATYGRKFFYNFRKAPMEQQPRVVIEYTTDNALASIQKFEYDGNNNRILAVDGNGNYVKYHYNSVNQLIREERYDSTDKLITTDSFEYNSRGLKTKAIDGNGNEQVYEYDALGQLVKITKPCRTLLCTDSSSKTIAYNSNGQVVEETDAEGNTTKYEYDALGQKTKIVDALGNETKFEYNSVGRVTKEINAKGAATEYKYDLAGNVIEVTNALGKKASYKYDLVGNLIEQTNFNNEVSKFTYDANGNLTSQIDPLGNTTQLQYDPRNSLIAMTDPRGNKTQYVYDGKGDKVKEINSLGKAKQFEYDREGNIILMIGEDNNTIEFTYDGAYRRTGEKDQKGNQIKYEFDAAGNITKVTDKNGKIRTFKYDFKNNLVESVNPNSTAKKFEYNKNNQPTKITDEAGFETKFIYDKLGRKVQSINPMGYSVNISYDSTGKIESETDLNGNISKYKYDAVGNLIEYTDRSGNVRKLNYDAAGRVVETINSDGGVTKTNYDVLGRVISSIDALGNTTQYQYDKNSNLVSTIDPNGTKLNFSYDALDRQTSIVYPDGTEKTRYNSIGKVIEKIDKLNNVTKYEYDKVGNLTKTIDAKGNATQFNYDNEGNLIKLTDAKGNATSFKYDDLYQKTVTTFADNSTEVNTYDAVGRVVEVTNQNGQKSKTNYDKVGNVIESIDPLQNKVSYSYDKNGNLVSKVDAKGNITKYNYSKNDELSKVTDALGGETKYEYNSNGNLVKEIDAKGNTKSFEYDKLGRLLQEKNALGQVNSYKYDKVGNLTEEKEPTGNIIKYKYDKLGRLLEKNYADDALDVVFTYDALGNIINLKNGTEEYRYSYDQISKITSTKDSAGNEFKYSYDQLGNRSSVIYPDGTKLNYSFDKLGREVSQNINGDNEIKFAYDPTGKLIKQTNPDGSESLRTYDNAGRLIKLEHKNKIGSFAKYTITLDQNGDKVKEDYEFKSLENGKITKGTKNYEYDALSRLTKSTSKSVVNDLKIPDYNESFTYDKNSNRTVLNSTVSNVSVVRNVSYKYNQINALTEDSEFNYAYDANGNRISKIAKNGTAGYKFGYDLANNLTEVDSKVGNNVSDFSYRYDALGRRVEKINNEKDTVIDYLYDTKTYNSITEKVDNKSVNYMNVDIDTLPEPLVISASIKNNTKTDVDYYFHDGLGSVVGIIGSTSGNTFFDYRAYGEANGTKLKGTKTYSQKEMDAESGMYYYGSRYFDTATGTWNKQDSYRGDVADPASRNRYAFVKGDPINNIDRDGFNAMSLEDARDSISNQITSTNNQISQYQQDANQLTNALPYLRADMEAKWWSAHFAQNEMYEYTGMQGVIGRLQARGYEMNYPMVMGYLQVREQEKKVVYLVKNAVYHQSVNTYYGAIDTISTLNTLISEGKENVSTLNNFLGEINGAIDAENLARKKEQERNFFTDFVNDLNMRLDIARNDVQRVWDNRFTIGDNISSKLNTFMQDPLGNLARGTGGVLLKLGTGIVDLATTVGTLQTRISYGVQLSFGYDNPALKMQLQMFDDWNNDFHSRVDDQFSYLGINAHRQDGRFICSLGEGLCNVTQDILSNDEAVTGAQLVYDVENALLELAIIKQAVKGVSKLLGGGADDAGKIVVPKKATDTIDYIKSHNGAPPPNFKGGKIFRNDLGELPVGRYLEYDIDPKVSGITRNAERIVIDQETGRIWYTNNHYAKGSFVEIK